MADLTEDEIVDIGRHTHAICVLGSDVIKGHDHYCRFEQEPCDDIVCLEEIAFERVRKEYKKLISQTK